MEGDTVSFCPFNQALIVIGALQMSGLGCVIPSNCCSITVGRRECTSTCLGGGESERKRGSVSVCMTRGCIRGAGIESLERRGRAGVTNQLWESRLEKTHPLFPPREKVKEQIRQTSSGQKHYKWMAITKNIFGGGQKSFPSHSASHICFHPFPFHPSNNKCEDYHYNCIRLRGYLASPSTHPSTDG